MTIQRMKILEYLQDVTTHPTADIIFEQVAKDVPTITLATVYRNLHALEEQGLVQKIELNGEAHFDGNVKAHLHNFCEKCGKIMDVFLNDVSSIKNFRFRDFKPNSLTIIYRGLCKKCKAKKGG